MHLNSEVRQIICTSLSHDALQVNSWMILKTRKTSDINLRALGSQTILDLRRARISACQELIKTWQFRVTFYSLTKQSTMTAERFKGIITRKLVKSLWLHWMQKHAGSTTKVAAAKVPKAYHSSPIPNRFWGLLYTVTREDVNFSPTFKFWVRYVIQAVNYPLSLWVSISFSPAYCSEGECVQPFILIMVNPIIVKACICQAVLPAPSPGARWRFKSISCGSTIMNLIWRPCHSFTAIYVNSMTRIIASQPLSKSCYYHSDPSDSYHHSSSTYPRSVSQSVSQSAPSFNPSSSSQIHSTTHHPSASYHHSTSSY